MRFVISFFVATLALTSDLSAAEIIFESPCKDRVEDVLNSTLGTFYTEKELNYDELTIKVSAVSVIDVGYEYDVEFDSQDGWITFSKDCKTASAQFGFLKKKINF